MHYPIWKFSRGDHHPSREDFVGPGVRNVFALWVGCADVEAAPKHVSIKIEFKHVN